MLTCETDLDRTECSSFLSSLGQDVPFIVAGASHGIWTTAGTGSSRVPTGASDAMTESCVSSGKARSTGDSSEDSSKCSGWTAVTSTAIVLLRLELDENAAGRMVTQTTFKSVRKTISKTRPQPREFMIMLVDDRVKNFLYVDDTSDASPPTI